MSEVESAKARLLHCTFCLKSQDDVSVLIAGPSVFICNECVGICNDIIREKMGPRWKLVRDIRHRVPKASP